MKKLILNICLLFFAVNCVAQKSPGEILQNWSERNFFEVQKEMNDHFKKKPPNSPGYNQWKRMEYNLLPRLYPSGEVINFEAKNTAEYLRLKNEVDNASRDEHGGWLFFGPSHITNGNMGRINCVEISPVDSNIMYVGSSSGGAWKTDNGGINWKSISPDLPSLAIADLEIDWATNTIYLMTGDPHGNSRPSIGLLKSTDDGNTWHFTDLVYNLTDFIFAEKLLADPNDLNKQYLATTQGVKITADGWGSSSSKLNSFTIFDLEFEPGNNSIVYTSVFSSPNQTPLWKLTNDGVIAIALGDPLLSEVLGGAFKMEIATTPDNPKCIYAFGGFGSNIGLMRSISSGQTGSWEVRDTNIPNLGSQSSYNMGIAVDPNDYNNVYVAQVWSKRSTSGGGSTPWINPTNGGHADVHELQFYNGHTYMCNDGGLFKTTDGGDIYQELSQGMGITEIYRIAGTPQDPGLIYAGSQDNGTFQRSGAGSKKVTGNDGTTCLINYLNKDIAYTSAQNGSYYKTTDGGMTFSSITVPQQGEGPFISEIIMDPVDPNILYLGQKNVYRSDNGLAAGSFYDLGKPQPDGHIVNLAMGNTSGTILYASSGNRLYKTTDALITSGTASWDSLHADLPDDFVTGIAVDPKNNDRIFITYSGYSSGIKVFKSEMGGAPGSWENISGSLPNVPANCIQFHENLQANDALYIGTDIGVFYRDNSLGDWIYFSNYLPSVRVNDLYINESANLIIAGTYGRGLWISGMYSDCPDKLTLTLDQGGTFFFSANDNIRMDAALPKDITSNVNLRAGNFVVFEPGFEGGNGGKINATIGPCSQIYTENNTSSNGTLLAVEPRKVNYSAEVIRKLEGRN